MDMDLVEAEIKEALDMTSVLFQVRRDQDAALEVLGAHQLGKGFKVLRRANILLRGLDAPVGPLLKGVVDGLFVGRGPGDVQLEQARHRARVLAGLARSLLKALQQHFELFRRRSRRDQAIAQASSSLCRFRTGGRYQDWRWRLRARVEASTLHAQVLTAVADLFAAEEQFDDLD